MNPLSFLLVCFAGWMNRQQQVVVEYLQEEVKVLQEQLGKRPRFTEDQRRRLAVKGKPVGRRGLLRFASIVTPDTLLAWHRRLIAKKYDSSKTGVVPEPGEDWMKQVARNLTDASEGFLRGSRFLIHDRATVFTEQFRAIIKSAGMEPLRLPGRSPNLNAFAERFVRSIKDSCLDQLVFFGESSLRRAVSEFVLHYHTERNHQGLENKIIQPEFAEFPEIGTIRSRQRLGGLLRYYYREAA